MAKVIIADELIKYLEENLEIWKHPEALDWAICKIKHWDTIDAEKIVRCANCYHYDHENLLCHRYGLENPVIMIDQGYCSCGIDREVMNDMLERCRANGGWCTPGYIVSADEMKRIMEDWEGGCHDK